MGCALSKDLRRRTTQAEAWLSVPVFQVLSDPFLSRCVIYTLFIPFILDFRSLELRGGRMVWFVQSKSHG